MASTSARGTAVAGSLGEPRPAVVFAELQRETVALHVSLSSLVGADLRLAVVGLEEIVGRAASRLSLGRYHKFLTWIWTRGLGGVVFASIRTEAFAEERNGWSVATSLCGLCGVLASGCPAADGILQSSETVDMMLHLARLAPAPTVKLGILHALFPLCGLGPRASLVARRPACEAVVANRNVDRLLRDPGCDLVLAALMRLLRRALLNGESVMTTFVARASALEPLARVFHNSRNPTVLMAGAGVLTTLAIGHRSFLEFLVQTGVCATLQTKRAKLYGHGLLLARVAGARDTDAELARLSAAAIKMQSLWRAFKATRRFAALRAVTAQMQRVQRARLASKREQSHEQRRANMNTLARQQRARRAAVLAHEAEIGSLASLPAAKVELWQQGRAAMRIQRAWRRALARMRARKQVIRGYSDDKRMRALARARAAATIQRWWRRARARAPRAAARPNATAKPASAALDQLSDAQRRALQARIALRVQLDRAHRPTPPSSRELATLRVAAEDAADAWRAQQARAAASARRRQGLLNAARADLARLVSVTDASTTLAALPLAAHARRTVDPDSAHAVAHRAALATAREPFWASPAPQRVAPVAVSAIGM